MKSQKEMIKLFKGRISDHKRYQKSARIKARLASIGERVETIINGEKETSKTADANDVLIIGPLGEHYLIPRTKFEERYHMAHKISSELQSFDSKGTCIAFEYNGFPMEFAASWGEAMILKPGDYLASPSEDFTEVYRIERGAFFQTYSLICNTSLKF